jgi:hypothetical protein
MTAIIQRPAEEEHALNLRENDDRIHWHLVNNSYWHMALLELFLISKANNILWFSMPAI